MEVIKIPPGIQEICICDIGGEYIYFTSSYLNTEYISVTWIWFSSGASELQLSVEWGMWMWQVSPKEGDKEGEEKEEK